MRVKTIFRQLVVWAIIIGFSISLAACGGAESSSGQPTLPIASITSPENNASLVTGQELLITFNAADVAGIQQIELAIDGQPVLVEPVNPPVNAYTASHRWVADRAGSHVIELRVFNVNQQASEPAQVFISVVGSAAAEPTPTATITPVPPTSLPPTVTAAPQAAITATATSEPTLAVPLVTALVGLNVRSGPGTQYPVVGRLAANETAPITGRDGFGGWWRITFQHNSGDTAWIAAGAGFSAASGTEAVPVVEVAPPAVVATLPAPTATPGSLKPTIFSFTADRYTILPGEAVVLRWDLSNATAAFLRYNNVTEGVVAPGSKTVSPTAETKYTLVAQNNAGETIAEVVIKVSGVAATPVPILKTGKSVIAGGQYADFDQGLVTSNANSSADFLWDGNKQQFTPQGGASGTLLTGSFDNITVADCAAATYGQPISGVDGSSQISGCYITNENRYGKFIVTGWDIDANVTVQWLTWDVKK